MAESGAAHFREGTRVEFQGLVGSAWLNGKTGHLLSFDRDAGRWGVEIDVTPANQARHLISAKEQNLKKTSPLALNREAIQQLVDSAEEGSRVALPAGRFVSSPSSGSPAAQGLVIKSGIRMVGKGELTVLQGIPVSVDAGARGSLLELSNFCVMEAPVEVSGAAISRVRLSRLKISMKSGNSDCLILKEICKDPKAQQEILVKMCEIDGGADGVFIATSGVHLKDCEIRFAQSRGIFAKDFFVIEDCEVSNCGAYGIKTRAGCERRGVDNDIQPGPWDGFAGGNVPPFGGMDGFMSQFGGMNMGAKTDMAILGQNRYGLGEGDFLLGGDSDSDFDDGDHVRPPPPPPPPPPPLPDSHSSTQGSHTAAPSSSKASHNRPQTPPLPSPLSPSSPPHIAPRSSDVDAPPSPFGQSGEAARDATAQAGNAKQAQQRSGDAHATDAPPTKSMAKKCAAGAAVVGIAAIVSAAAAGSGDSHTTIGAVGWTLLASAMAIISFNSRGR